MSDTSEFQGYKSLAKAIQVVESFIHGSSQMGVVEISRTTGINKSSVHNILKVFEAYGYIAQDASTRKYSLGLRFLTLANVVRSGLNVRRIAYPFMTELSERFGETVHLTVFTDDETVYIESVQPPERSVSRLAVGKRAPMHCTAVGKRAPMHCTAVGKAILAYLPQATVARIVQQGLPRFTPNTLTDEEALAAELARVRVRGYALDNEEHEEGIRCVSVPIRGESGEVFSSLSLSGPATRFDEPNIEAMVLQLMIIGAEISRRLGADVGRLGLSS